MVKYISRERLRNNLMEIVENMCTDFVISAINKCIDNLPVADVAPVKHGTWIEVEGDKLVGIDSNGKDMYRYYRYNICAKCGKRNAIKSNFCPNCGAKMDLE